MENSLTENSEERRIYIEEICQRRCLRYKLNYKGENIFKNKKFLKWLNEEKIRKGKKGTIYICDKCNIFIYDESLRDFHCCKNNLINMVCKYCGKIYYGQSYCCAINGLINVSEEYLLDGRYSCNFKNSDEGLECFKSFPLAFNLIFIGTIFFGFYLKRTSKKGKEYYSTYESNYSKSMKFVILFFVLFDIILSLIYIFPFVIIYIIYLIKFFVDYEIFK